MANIFGLKANAQLADIAQYTASETDNSGLNQFDKTDITIGKTVDSATGLLTNSPTNNASGFIVVTPGATYTLCLFAKIAYYTDAEVFISAATLNHLRTTVTIPETATKIRLVCNDVFLNTAQINTGTGIVSIEEPYLSIKTYRLPNSELAQRATADKYILDGTLEGAYTSPTLDAQLTMATWVAADVYALYDALVTAYPNYVSKVTLGNDASGNTIYRYNFAFIPAESVDVKTPKVLLVAGIHGDEKAAVYALYQTMKQICDGWASNSLLDTLRWNFAFYVVPIVSVSAFNANTRYNAQSINVNRNFLIEWSAAEDHPGDAPLSSKEAQFIDKLILENRDAILFASFHHFDTNTYPNYFVNPYCGSTLIAHIAQSTIQRLSRKWKAAYAWLPQDDTTFFGGTVTINPGGSEVLHAEYHGIPAINFEICKQFVLETGYAPFNSVALTLGADAIINMLIIALKTSTDYYNWRV